MPTVSFWILALLLWINASIEEDPIVKASSYIAVGLIMVALAIVYSKKGNEPK